ncbi:MAG TPA: DNA repair protein RecN [Methylibium sp.]|uniref:DNA repair protein RecN n=1 Tax=Methylibium sp. TaxID=2067992 RepID=UPI002DB867D1|nr:DNA repair protein RecN [Methylibium sp.]HEU4460791.1 DNA repair protein RecN [Methylibium sp.]
MLRRIALRDFVIVESLDLDWHAGFTALTGETGAGKSILIDALQLALGQRADAAVVREGAVRAEIAAEFDAPASLQAWLADAGFTEPDETADALLLRRNVDAHGKSRAWIQGRPATLAQLREAADHLVDIHGQHAWQSLTRPDAVRALLDGYAGIDTGALAQAWAGWRDALAALNDARSRQSGLDAERERLQWQIGELDKLAPGDQEWPELNAEQRRLSHAQAILDAVHRARRSLSDADGDADGSGQGAADAQLAEAIEALDAVVEHDAELAAPLEVLRSAQAQIEDAAHTLALRLRGDGPDPARLAALDERLATWLALARRFRRTPEELPALLGAWRAELAQLEAATDLDALEGAERKQRKLFEAAARAVSSQRRGAAPKLAAAVTAAMQQLGMAGGRFEIALDALAEPQRHGLEAIEFRVAGHAGSTPRALAKVASGGELSRIALAIAVTTSQRKTATDEVAASTLIFDEIDAGVGGQVADAVGRLMRRLGRERQVLCVTHLPQVAACADHHCRVRKLTTAGRTTSGVETLDADARAEEVARMLGGDASRDTSLAHARALIEAAARGGGDTAAAPAEPRRRRA